MEDFGCAWCLRQIPYPGSTPPLVCPHCLITECAGCGTGILESSGYCHGCGEIRPPTRSPLNRPSSDAHAYALTRWRERTNQGGGETFWVGVGLQGKHYLYRTSATSDPMGYSQIDFIRDLTDDEAQRYENE